MHVLYVSVCCCEWLLSQITVKFFLVFPILVVVKAGAEWSFNFKITSNVRLKTAVDEASRQS